jgi:type II secretory pathway pseudopilin PulG
MQTQIFKPTSNHSPLPQRRQNGNRRQRGFLSVELGLVLLVVAILVVGAVAYYNSNLRKTSISTNVQQIQAIAGSAKATYGYQNLYGQVNTAVAVQGHLIPDSLRDGAANTATNNFGAAIVVSPVNGTGTNDMLQVTWGNVPSDQCSDIVLGVATSLRRISVGATVVKPLDGAINIATLNDACEANTNTGNVALTLAIGRS